MKNKIWLIIFLVTTIQAAPGYADKQPPASLSYFQSFPLAHKGYVLIGKDKPLEALPYFIKAVRLMPENLDYRIQLVNLLILGRQYDAAQDAADAGLKMSPGNPSLSELREQITLEQQAMRTDKEAAPLFKQKAICDSPQDVEMATTGPMHLELAYCALRKNEISQATAHFVAASQSGNKASALQAFKQLGYIYSASKNEKLAIEAWKSALDLEQDSKTYLLLAHSLRMQKQHIPSQEAFQNVQKSDLDEETLRFYNEENTAQEDMKAGKKAPAYPRTVEALQEALKKDPDNVNYKLSLAYAYRAKGENQKALSFFAAGIKENSIARVHEDFAYTFKDESRRDEAATQLRAALPKLKDREKYLAYRREIQQLEDRWQTIVGATYRDGISRAPGAPGDQGTDSGYQYGMETVYSPPQWQKDNRRLQLYGQLFISSERGKIDMDQKSTTGVLGIRGTPLSHTEWYLYAARAIAIGENGVSDWQLRTTYGYTQGFDIKPDDQLWRYAFFSPDISYLTRKRELFATAEARYGVSVQPIKDWVITPHIVGNASYQKTPLVRRDSLEAGPGLGIKYWFAQSKERAPRGSHELLLQWRHSVSGNVNKSGPLIRYVLQY